MAIRTIYISEEDTLANIIQGCPHAVHVLEKQFGQDFMKRGDPGKVTLLTAAVQYNKALYPILMQLNRICI